MQSLSVRAKQSPGQGSRGHGPAARRLELHRARQLPLIDYAIYDADYYESGVQSGKSGYQNYSWMPELTIRMAHYLIRELGLTAEDKVLDFGCAKGYLVRALRTLDIDAWGVDVSEYAINKADVGMAKYLTTISSISDVAVYDGYTTVIAKDVLEHVPEHEILTLMRGWNQAGSNLFVAVPVAIEGTERFVVPQYHNDVTHITIKPRSWWEAMCTRAGYEIVESRFSFPGVKENWVGKYPEGNVFLWLRSRG